jgi:serine O-acetyltransferase
MAERLAIIGWEEGSAGHVHSWIEDARDVSVAAFVHPDDTPPQLDPAVVLAGRAASRFDFPHDGRFKGVPLVAATDWPARLREQGIGLALITISDERARHAAIATAQRGGIELICALHPSAVLLPEARLGANVIAHARAVIGYRAEIGDGVILNTGAQVDHHSVLRACSTLDPGVILAGGVLVEAYAHLHPGAIVAKRRRIGCDAVVAAGAVVVRDVPDGVRVMGVPARPG